LGSGAARVVGSYALKRLFKIAELATSFGAVVCAFFVAI